MNFSLYTDQLHDLIATEPKNIPGVLLTLILAHTNPCQLKHSGRHAINQQQFLAFGPEGSRRGS